MKNYEHWRTRSNQFKINFKLFIDKIKESRRQKLCTDHLLFYSILQATQACIFFNRCNKQASEKFLLPSKSNMTLGLQGHTLVSSPAKANQPWLELHWNFSQLQNDQKHNFAQVILLNQNRIYFISCLKIQEEVHLNSISLCWQPFNVKLLFYSS